MISCCVSFYFTPKWSNSLLTWMMVAIENAGAKHATVAMAGIVDGQRVRQIVDVVQLGTLLCVVAGDKQVDVVWRTTAQVLGEIFAREMRRRLGRQLVAVAHLVQRQVLGNVLGKLNGVARFADGGHQQVVGELVDFVHIWQPD